MAVSFLLAHASVPLRLYRDEEATRHAAKLYTKKM
jgi:hypothetical protein